MRIEHVTDIDELRKVGEYWLAEQKAEEFGLPITPDDIIADSKQWLATGAGTVIGLVHESEGYVGFMSVFCQAQFMRRYTVAFEKYWYVMPKYRSGAVVMIVEAKNWAREQGASHLVLSASAMASEMYFRLCNLYEKLDMKRFETSYICEL